MRRKITREKAQAKGLTRYFTGKLCVWRHRKERYVSSGRCVKCQQEDGEANQENKKAYNRIHREGRREENRAYAKVYREANKKRIAAYNKEYGKAYRAANKEEINAHVRAYRKSLKK